ERQRDDRAIPGRQPERAAAPGLLDQHRRAAERGDLRRARLRAITRTVRAVDRDSVEDAVAGAHVLGHVAHDLRRSSRAARARAAAEDLESAELEHAGDELAEVAAAGERARAELAERPGDEEHLFVPEQ